MYILIFYIMHIGDKIREWRQYFGMSQQALADKTGPDVSQVNVSSWELNDRPPIDAVVRIAAALGLSLSEFFRDARELSRDERALLEGYRRAPKNIKDGVLKILE